MHGEEMSNKPKKPAKKAPLRRRPKPPEETFEERKKARLEGHETARIYGKIRKITDLSPRELTMMREELHISKGAAILMSYPNVKCILSDLVRRRIDEDAGEDLMLTHREGHLLVDAFLLALSDLGANVEAEFLGYARYYEEDEPSGQMPKVCHKGLN